MKNKEAFVLVCRYVILVLLGLFKLQFFYFVFTPLTVRPIFAVLSFLYNNVTLLEGNLLFFGGIYIQIIPACVAGAAYYLLLILNLTTSMSVGKRIRSILFLVSVFLILNITRILIFANLALSGYQYFDIAHKLTWYFGSTIMIVFVWFVNVWIFRIKNIPVYTDMKELYKEIAGK